MSLDDLDIELDDAEPVLEDYVRRPMEPHAIVGRLGGGGERDPEVYIRVAAVEAILHHATRTLRTECGGLLVGQVLRDEQGRYIRIAGAISAPHTRQGPTHVTFTQESWAEMLQAAELQYPDETVVGWYHTHPGLGVFMSSYDRFIQEHFFAAPGNVALVLDPRAMRWGVFRWEDSALTAAGHIYFYAEQADEGKQILELTRQLQISG